MKHQITAPSVGESVTEVSILKWNKQSGEAVKTGEQILEIESDKATVEIVAENDGVLQILKGEGETVAVGEVIAEIDDEATPTVTAQKPAQAAAPPPPPPGAPQAAAQPPPPPPGMGAAPQPGPAVRKMAQEMGISPAQVQGTGKGGRVTKADLLQASTAAPAPAAAVAPAAPTQVPVQAPPAAPRPLQPQRQYTDQPGDRRVPMSRLRQRIAERLVQAQHNAAILTTFNEADMSAIMALRKEHKEKFKVKHGVNLGFMSFFTKACIAALKELPAVNAMIDGTDIVYHDYYDIGIAVGTDRGLVVPVLRRAENMNFPEIEKKIIEYATKARDGKLSIAEMSGGTFTITNGGVYGSLLSTPILNPPQSAILGMHKIQERPVVIDGKIEVRPMMYLALSYDHRIIDGKEAVTFLVTVKDHLENPEKLGLEY